MSRLSACARGSTTRRHRPRNAAVLDADLRELTEHLAVGQRQRRAHLRVGVAKRRLLGPRTR